MSNIEVLSKANDWINAGHKVALATVLKTWGSAPRRAGSQLACLLYTSDAADE